MRNNILENICIEILQENALQLKHYPGAVSWLQTAVEKMQAGKQVTNCNNLEMIFICVSFQLIFMDSYFSECELRKS